MTVSELIAKLQEFPPECEVVITDGHRYHFYRGDFEIGLFEEEPDGSQVVDIGIGGYDEEGHEF